MNILIIGSGGREHAIYEHLRTDDSVENVYLLGNNGGVNSQNLFSDVDGLDFPEVEKIISNWKIDLTIVGPELYLDAGIVDYLRQNGHRVSGPTKYCANLETSKLFAKELMTAAKIPTASYNYVTNLQDGCAACTSFPIVLKYNGLAAGKGVSICNTREEAEAYFREVFNNDRFGTEGVVVEECLVGEEYSVFAYVNGEDYVLLPVAQDYKRAYDHDLGPNTGGMGANTTSKYDNQLPFISENIIEPLLKEFANRNEDYTGFLYVGLIETATGPKVIEFNARLGDPETEVVLQKLKTNLIEIINSIDNRCVITPEFNENEWVGVVLAASDYPNEYQKNVILNIPNGFYPLFHMGTKVANGQLYSTGGRVLMICSDGLTVKQASESVYQKLDTFKNENLYFRKDIGENRV